MAEAKVNYTEDMVDTLLARYEELGNDGLETIAEELGRTVRSVRSKLVREGVYKVTEVKPKAFKAEGPTKKELLNHLESIAPFEVDGLMGATKAALAAVIAFVEANQEDQGE
jgi:hypothetical protein